MTHEPSRHLDRQAAELQAAAKAAAKAAGFGVQLGTMAHMTAAESTYDHDFGDQLPGERCPRED